MSQHNTKLDSFQDLEPCQNISTGDFARLAQGGGRAVAVGGARTPPCAQDAFTPDTFDFYVMESRQWQGKDTLVIDRSAATVTLPPAGNTGVTVTFDLEWYKTQSYHTQVDTIEGTFPIKDYEQLNMVLEHYTRVFGGGDDLEKGLRGYPYQRMCTDGVRLLYDPNRLTQGVHLIMSGEACQRHILRSGDPEALLITFIGTQEHEFRCSRFDLACDSSVVSMSQVVNAVDSGQLVTRTRKGHKLLSFDPSTGKETGATVYIGSGKSDRMVRFYDKAAERGIEGHTITRCEAQLRNEYAQVGFMTWLMGKIDPETLVASAIDFREVTSDSNVTRRPRLAWWDEWIGHFPKIAMFTGEKVAESVTRSLHWFKSQVAPTFAFLLRAIPGGDWIAEADRDGERRMAPALRALLDAFSSGSVPRRLFAT